MFFIFGFFFLVTQVFSHLIPIEVKPNGPKIIVGQNIDRPFNLTWEFISSPGSKLIVTCRTVDKNCENVKITVIDDSIEKNGCLEWKDLQFLIKNKKVGVNIHTDGPPYGAHCEIVATENYLEPQEEKEETNDAGMSYTNKTTCICGRINKHSGIFQKKRPKRPLRRNQVSFLAGVRVSGTDENDCSGTIITPYHVLTAAQCIIREGTENSEYEVTIGGANQNSKSVKSIPVKEVIVHNGYEPPEYWRGPLNDIALLFVKEKIQFGNFIGPMCMPNAKQDLVGQYVSAIGLTNNSNSNYGVMKLNLRIIHLETCKRICPHSMENDLQLCASQPKSNKCMDGIGSPVVWLNPSTNEYTQYGIISHKIDCNSTNPLVITNVVAFMDWIKMKINGTYFHEMCY